MLSVFEAANHYIWLLEFSVWQIGAKIEEQEEEEDPNPSE